MAKIRDRIETQLKSRQEKIEARKRTLESRR